MKYLTFVAFLVCLALAGCFQTNSSKATVSGPRVGGTCEGCDPVYLSPVPFEKLTWVDTLPDYKEKGPRLVISGVIYKQDGKTPARDVLLYIYHTDQTGKYTNRYNEKDWAGRHGYIKGWIRTNEKGQYKFYTLKPAPYPGTNIPSHIHPVIKEQQINEYWIDEYLFDDDPFLTAAERKRQEGRGGNGILKVTVKDGIMYAQRNIYLGKNIPGYTVN